MDVWLKIPFSWSHRIHISNSFLLKLNSTRGRWSAPLQQSELFSASDAFDAAASNAADFTRGGSILLSSKNEVCREALLGVITAAFAYA